jgi:hypothetical protein
VNWEYLAINACGYGMAVLLLLAISRNVADPLSFAHVFSLVWGCCILASQLPPAYASVPAPGTLLVLFSAWWAFLLGSLAVLRKPVLNPLPEYKLKRTTSIVVLWALIAAQIYTLWLERPELEPISVVSLPAALKQLAYLRTQGKLGADIPWFLHFVRSGFVYYLPLALLLRRRRWISRWVLWLAATLAMGTSLVRFTRAPLAWALTVLVVAWWLVYRPGVKKLAIVGVTAVLAFAYVFLWFQAMITQKRPSLVNVYALLDPYWGASMRAYESILLGEYPKYEDGWYSLDMVNYILKKLKLISDYPELVRHYGTNPTNLYTFLDAYTLDFGIPGALLGAFLTGAATAAVYKLLRTSQRFCLLTLYCTLVYFCVMTTANNEFIRNTFVIVLVFSVGLDAILLKRDSHRVRLVSRGWSPTEGGAMTQGRRPRGHSTRSLVE